MRKIRLLVALPILAVVLVLGGTWLYINVIRADPEPELTLTAEEPDATTAGDVGPVAGTWTVSGGSTAGYRVKELLFGQSTEGVGRTSAVTGAMTIEATTVTTADFEVDMTTVTSDDDRRDGQFHGRIMETGEFPAATFKLTQPIELGDEPAAGEVVTATATGDLTLHGVTRSVTFDIEAKHTAAGIEIDGDIPVVFADYEIENPSNMAASTEDNGLLEFLLKLVAA